MTLKTESRSFGEIRLVKYIFEKKGDVLPLHSHSKETQHITIVVKGSVHLSGPSLNKKLKQGEVYDYLDAEQTHQITALKDNTIILNIPKKYNQYLIEEESEEEKAQREEFEKKYHEEFRRQQMEQILATEKETQIIKKELD